MLLLQQIFSGKTKQEIIAILEENFIQVETKTKKIGEIYSGRYSGKKFLKEYTCEKLNLFFL